MSSIANVPSAQSGLKEISTGQMVWVIQQTKCKERKEWRGNTNNIKNQFKKWARLTIAARSAFLVDEIIKKCKEVIKARTVEEGRR